MENENLETQAESPAKNEKVKIGKASKLRRSKNARLTVIIILMIIIAVLFFFFEKARIVLIGAFLALLLALGLEVSGNDWDLNKLWETGSFSESKIERSADGNWLIDDERCQANNLNCSNFTYQEEAQDLFEYCGGLTNDIHGLDRDKDGLVCEALPALN